MPELTKQEMKNVIDGKGAASRIPLTYHLWASAGIFGEYADTAGEVLRQCPCDVDIITINIPQIFDAPADDPEYRFVNKSAPADTNASTGLDARVAIENWEELDEILERFPSPEYPGLIPQAEKTEKYRVINWWYWMFERLWSLRGMENALTDFYTDPEGVHRLFSKLTDFYCRIAERGKQELDADAVFISDDIGTQTGPFFSMEIFNEFFKPYYKRLIDKAHSLGMHVWMHSCGNIELYLPGFIEIGLDVIHPIQTYTMEEAKIAREFGDKICIWAGFDVQQTIPYGTPDEARVEVRRMIDTYAREDGRFMLTFGNFLTPDCPVESLRAVLEESLAYGTPAGR